MRAFLLLTTAMLGLASAGAAQATNLVVNGDFSTGDFTGWTQAGNTQGTYVQNGMLIAGPAVTDGFLFQSIQTVIGQTYDFSFDLANTGSAPNEFFAFSDLASGTPELQLIDSNAFAFQTFSYVFKAKSATTGIVFEFLQDPAYWNLDNVSVTATGPVAATPLPAGGLLLLTAMVPLGGLALRRAA